MQSLATRGEASGTASNLSVRYALRVALFFIAVSLFWILFSDTAITRISDSPLWLFYAQTFKGIFYVTVVGSVIYFLSLKSHRHLEQAQKQESQAALSLFSSLALAMEYRDGASGEHCNRMSRFVRVVAASYGYPKAKADMLSRAALLHDVGKIGVPDAILKKPGPLTPEERAVMQRHVQIGVDLLMNSDNPLIKLGGEIILTHHENWDGSGYPNRISGKQIPESGRIVSICDVFDALLSERPYKRAWAFQNAVEEIRSLSGTKFDPELVSAFNRALPELSQIVEEAC